MDRLTHRKSATSREMTHELAHGGEDEGTPTDQMQDKWPGVDEQQLQQVNQPQQEQAHLALLLQIIRTTRAGGQHHAMACSSSAAVLTSRTPRIFSASLYAP